MNADISDLLQQARAACERADFSRAEEVCSRLLVAAPACVEAHQLLARIHLGRGEGEKADEILRRRDELPVDERYVDWGAIAEEAGDLPQAAQVYERCLRLSPPPPAALYRLGMLHLERGERPRAMELLGDAVRLQPDFAQALVDLGQCYAEEGWWGQAAQAWRQALETDAAPAEARSGLALAEARLRELAALPAPEEGDDDGELAASLHALFQGREGVHARQWVDAGGRVGYGPVHEPLSERLLRLHLRGEATLGAYLVRSDDTVLFAAIDIDVRKSALAEASPEGGLSAALAGRVQADARRLKRFCEHLRLPVYAEDSGYKGMHLWLFFAEPVPAAQVKRFLEALVQRAGPPSPELHWEIFPKQERVEEGGLGNLIKIPLGVHRRTGRRCLFTDEDGRPLADQAALLRGVQRLGRAAFDEVVARLVRPQAEGGVAAEREELLRAFPQFEPLLAGCAVIDALAEKARVTHHLTHDERMVLKCVLAHAGEPGHKLIHAVVGSCLDYSPRITQQQIERTPPHPISCPRIRQRLPEVTSAVNCACTFALPEGGYPSPLLHIDERFTRGKSHSAARHGELLERYVQVRRQVQKARQELERLEEDLRYALRLSGEQVMRAGGWVLRCDDEGRLSVEVDEA